MSNPINMVVLAPGDNVGIATRDLSGGDCARDIRGQVVDVREAIPQGHKIALQAIAVESAVIRYGMPVGVMTSAVERGCLVHVHNVRSQYLNNDDDHFE